MKNENKSQFVCKMKDGSIFKMPNDSWQKAYDMKYEGDNQESIKNTFTELTAKHWKAKTVPTKFDFDVKWGQGETQKKYKNHADLGNEIMYIYIRTALMGIMFSEMGGNKECKVIGISDDGSVTTYTKKGAKKYKNINEAFKKKKAKK